MIGSDYMLVTAGNKTKFNTMTAGWGSFGVYWSKPVAICLVRPQRYTYQFMEKNDYFTLCFFDEKYRDILDYCGTYSGKDVDKIKETGLKPFETDLGNIAFEQARLIIECKKIYYDDVKPELFIDKDIVKKRYYENDFHRIYVGEIVNCFLNY